MADKGRVAMPLRDAAARGRDFVEVSLGYSADQAKEEAQRCLQCKHRPCVGGCPVGIDIPGFIGCLARGMDDEAYRVLKKYTALPAVCGRVCPQEKQCEQRCVRRIKGESVAIGNLERYAADTYQAHNRPPKSDIPWNGHRVAVVGAGPSGLSAAGELARLGYRVKVFEALHAPGGVLTYGIPEFRLPKAVVRREVEELEALGVEIACNIVIGRTITVDELFEEGFEAVYVGSGAGLPRFMGIPGEGLNGVLSANEYLTRVNLMGAWREDAATPVLRGRRVAVVGGGNVAMVAARSALRLGAECVSVVYRRGMEELPARLEEVHHALEEGISFNTLCAPIGILGENGWVRGLRCLKMELGEPDASGRRSPVEVPGSEFDIAVDTVIMAIGTDPNPLLPRNTKGLETDSRGRIVADANGLTRRGRVWAGGDAVTGAATVILAMGAGKAAARDIDRVLTAGG